MTSNKTIHVIYQQPMPTAPPPEAYYYVNQMPQQIVYIEQPQQKNSANEAVDCGILSYLCCCFMCCFINDF